MTPCFWIVSFCSWAPVAQITVIIEPLLLLFILFNINEPLLLISFEFTEPLLLKIFVMSPCCSFFHIDEYCWALVAPSFDLFIEPFCSKMFLRAHVALFFHILNYWWAFVAHLFDFVTEPLFLTCLYNWALVALVWYCSLKLNITSQNNPKTKIITIIELLVTLVNILLLAYEPLLFMRSEAHEL